jgi:hypothetical protein
MKYLPFVFELREELVADARKLGITEPLCEALRLIDQDRSWHDEVPRGHTRWIQNGEHVDVLALNATVRNRKNVRLATSLYLNRISSACLRIVGKDVDCLGASERNRRQQIAFQQLCGDVELTRDR